MLRKILIALLLASQAAQGFPMPQTRLQVITIYGHSMEPILRNGQSLLVDKGFPFERLHAGNVVWFTAPNVVSSTGRVIHRLVYKDFAGRWHTKGDNNPKGDFLQFVSRSNYLGLVLSK
jgi:signal peptidase I